MLQARAEGARRERVLGFADHELDVFERPLRLGRGRRRVGLGRRRVGLGRSDDSANTI